MMTSGTTDGTTDGMDDRPTGRLAGGTTDGRDDERADGWDETTDGTRMGLDDGRDNGRPGWLAGGQYSRPWTSSQAHRHSRLGDDVVSRRLLASLSASRLKLGARLERVAQTRVGRLSDDAAEELGNLHLQGTYSTVQYVLYSTYSTYNLHLQDMYSTVHYVQSPPIGYMQYSTVQYVQSPPTGYVQYSTVHTVQYVQYVQSPPTGYVQYTVEITELKTISRKNSRLF